MASTHGQFIWYDLITTDIEGATRFYTEILGWGTQVWNGPPPYTMWENEGVPIGGVVRIGEGMGDGPPHWLAYVSVDDVDATVSRAVELGGKLHSGPKDIPGSGRYAILSDPQGASFAIYRASSSSTGAEVTPGCGQFSWHELTASDYRAALDFYQRIFGWQPVSDFDMGAMGTYQMYGQDGKTYGGMFNKTPEMPMSPNWLCYVMVDDVNRTAERVKELGGKVVMGPMEVPGGDMVAQCVDPQGAMFAIHARR